MKKLLTILATLTILTASLFAASNDTANIKIKGNVDKTAYSLNLAYGAEKNTAEVIGSEDYVIQNTDNEDFDLTINGSTLSFFVSLNGNENSVPSINVSVTPGNFNPTSEGTFKPSDTVAVEEYAVENFTMAAGIHHNDTVRSFSLRWNGNSELTAGKYQSDVTVAYTVE